jgi:HTH-type transcriptional regulator/antitoxin HipB
MPSRISIRTARDLGAAIKEARTARGFSQMALGRAAGIHQPKISAIERGAPGVRVGLILRVLRALDLSITIDAAAAPSTQRTKRSRRKDDNHVDLDRIANTGLD